MPPPLPGVPQPPPRRGLHWIWIVLIPLAGLAVPVFAVPAAVAIPACNDYRLRAGVSEVFAVTVPLRQVVEHAAAEGRPCPITSTPEAVAGASAFSTPTWTLRVRRCSPTRKWPG